MIAITLGINVIDWCTCYDKIPPNFVDTQILWGSEAFQLVGLYLNTKV